MGINVVFGIKDCVYCAPVGKASWAGATSPVPVPAAGLFVGLNSVMLFKLKFVFCGIVNAVNAPGAIVWELC